MVTKNERDNTMVKYKNNKMFRNLGKARSQEETDKWWKGLSPFAKKEIYEYWEGIDDRCTDY